MILKILFKATLPLVAVVGIASYSLYAAGGDPLSILQRVGGGLGDRLSTLADSAGSSIGSARDRTAATFSAADSSPHQTLYRWTDAAGVMHFSNEPPADGQQAEALNVDPNRNVMSASKPAGASRVSHTPDGQQPLPGISGVLAPGMDPTRLVDQFRQAQQLQQNRLP